VFADSGISLGSAVTFVPEGYAGIASDGGAALAANAGHYNLAPGDDIPGRGSALLSNPTVKSLSANLRRQFGESFEAFVDASMFDNDSLTSSEGLASFVTIDPGSPDNPFTDPIDVAFHSPGGNLNLVSNSRTLQASGGVIVRLPHSWTVQSEYTWSRARFNYADYSPAITPDGFTALEDGELDVVKDLNKYPLDYYRFLFDAPTSIFGPADTVMGDGTFRLAGPGFELPAGPLNLSTLFEYRQEEAQGFIREDNFSGFGATYTFQPPRVQRVSSVYAEATAPLISSRNALSFVKELEVQLSGRHDQYSTTVPATAGVGLPSRDSPEPGNLSRVTNQVASTDYTVGLRFSPFKDLTPARQSWHGVPAALDRTTVPCGNGCRRDLRGRPEALGIAGRGVGSQDHPRRQPQSHSGSLRQHFGRRDFHAACATGTPFIRELHEHQEVRRDQQLPVPGNSRQRRLSAGPRHARCAHRSGTRGGIHRRRDQGDQFERREYRAYGTARL